MRRPSLQILALTVCAGAAAGCVRFGFAPPGDSAGVDAPGDGLPDGDGGADGAPGDGAPGDGAHGDGDGPPATGAHYWSRRLGRVGAVQSLVIATDGSGNTIVSGRFAGKIALGGAALESAGSSDVFLASFDSGGAHRWSKRFGGSGASDSRAVAVDASGRIYLAGHFEKTIALGGSALTSAGGSDIFLASFDPDGAHRWSRRLGGSQSDDARGLTVGPTSGHLFLVGSFMGAAAFGGSTLPSAGGVDIVLASFTADGGHRWSHGFGDSAFDEATAVAVDASGLVTITGHFAATLDVGGEALTSAGNTDVFVASFDEGGAHRWSRRFGGAGGDRATSLAVDPERGDIFFTGTFYHTIDFGGGARASAGGGDIFVASLDDTGAHRWSKAFGDASYDVGCAVAIDANHNIFVSGDIRGTVDFGGAALTSAGASDLFVASFAAAGAHRWSTRFGAAAADWSLAIAAAPGGDVAVAGGFRGTVSFDGHTATSLGEHDLFVASFNANAQYRWSQTFPGSAATIGTAAAIAGSGNVVVTGYFEGTSPIGGHQLESAGGHDVFLVSYTATGAVRWARSFGGPGSDWGLDVAVDASGNVYLVGSFYDTVDFGGGPLTCAGPADIFVASYTADGAHRWSLRLGGADNDQAVDVAVHASSIFVTGSFAGTADLGGGALTSAGQSDIFVASFNAVDGAHRWSRGIGGTSLDSGAGVAVDQSGRVAVTGLFSESADFGGGLLTSAGNMDVFVASYTADGAHRWSLRCGAGGADRGLGVAVDQAGNVAVTGAFVGVLDCGGADLTAAGGNDLFVASFTAAGAHRWSQRFGSAGEEGGQGVAVTPGGDVFVTGHFADVVDFGGGSLTSAGDDDLFVVGFTSEGSHRWSQRFGASGFDQGLGVAASDARLVVTGLFFGSVDFGGGALRAANAGFIAALAP